MSAVIRSFYYSRVKGREECCYDYLFLLVQLRTYFYKYAKEGPCPHAILQPAGDRSPMEYLD